MVRRPAASPLNVNYLAWSLSEAPHVLMIEVLMVIPFAFAGMFIGIAAHGTSPHASMATMPPTFSAPASGGIAAVLAMNALTITQLLITISLLACLAAAILLQWNRLIHLVPTMAALAFALMTAAWMPWEPAANQYKPLTLAKLFQGTREIYTTQGPLGRIDVLEGPSLHGARRKSAPITPMTCRRMSKFTPTATGPPSSSTANARTNGSSPTTAPPPRPSTSLSPHPAPPAGPSQSLRCWARAVVWILAWRFHHRATDITALELNPQIIRAA